MLRPHAQRRVRAAAAAAFLLTAAALAQVQDVASAGEDPVVVRPASAGRVVRTFDFEEQASNPFPIPQHWDQTFGDPNNLGRVVFPAWNEARIAYTSEGGEPYRGDGALELPTRGGSTRLTLQSGVLPVFRGTDYRISAAVSTRNLEHARAFLTARFLDAAGRRIPGADVASQPIISNDEWTGVAVELIGTADDAAFIQIELSVLQPREFEIPRTGAFQVWEQDLAAAAVFDDVSIAQLPRVELTTTDPINVFIADSGPTLRGLVRDLAGEPLTTTITIADIDGAIVESKRQTLTDGSLESSWQPRLPGYGWYSASMRVENASGEVGSARVDFAWLPAPAVVTGLRDSADRGPRAGRSLRNLSQDRRRFGHAFRTLPPDPATTVPRLASVIGSGFITLPAFDPASPAAPGEQNLYPAIDALLADGRDVTLAIPAAPLSTGGYADAWTTLAGDPAIWTPSMAPILEKYGQRIRSWQVGSLSESGAYWRPDPASEVSTIRRGLSSLVTGPVVGIPTMITLDWSDRALAALGRQSALLAYAPADITPEGLSLFMSLWSKRVAASPSAPGLDLFLQTHTADLGRRDHRRDAADLARRVAEVWRRASTTGGLDATTIGIDQPWTVSNGPRPRPMPAPELVVWRNLIDRLADRRYVGEFPVADGVTCAILAPSPDADPSRGGVLVAWNRWADPARAVLVSHLGDGPIRVVDIFGNARPVTTLSAPTGQKPPVRIEIGHEPVFIEGVDALLVRMIAGVRLELPFLESNTNEQERFILIENPWPRPINGSITINEPGIDGNGVRDRSWRISPRQSRFSIDPGGQARLPVRFAFNPAQEVSERELVMSLETGDLEGGVIQIRRTLDIALSTMRVDLAYAIGGEKGTDVIVEAAVSNTGDSALTLDLTAFAPELPRSKTTITELLPGRQTVRRFVFPDAVDALKGARIVVSVADAYSGAALTRSVEIR